MLRSIRRPSFLPSAPRHVDPKAIGLAALRALVVAPCLAWTLACASGEGPTRFTETTDVPWVELRAATGYNWSAAVKAMPTEVDRIDRVLRNRAVYREPGFGFGHLMLGSGALYPYHAHASPEAYHVLAGEAEWSVDGETRRVGPGTSIYHAPYADHRWVTTSDEPLRVVWAQWAPDGVRTGLVTDGLRRRGGSSTGDFFEGERRSRTVLPTRLAAPVGEPEAGTVIAEMARAREEARAGEQARPVVRAFVDAAGVPWNTELPGIRWRMVFGTPDLEWGHVEIDLAGGRRKVPGSGVPWVLHVLGGEGRVRIGDEAARAVRVGTTIVVRAGERVRLERPEGAEGAVAPLRGFWVRWAPESDLDYWARDYFLVEPMPRPPARAALDRDEPFFTPDAPRFAD